MVAAVQEILRARVEWLAVGWVPVLEFAARLADDVALVPAFAFASRDFDGWLLEQDRKLGSVHLYSDGNGSRRNGS